MIQRPRTKWLLVSEHVAELFQFIICIRRIDSIRYTTVVTDIFHEHHETRVDGFAITLRRLRRKGWFPWLSGDRGVPPLFWDCHSQMELLHINIPWGLRMIDEDKYGTISSFESSLETSFPPVFPPRGIAKKLHVNKVAWLGQRET